MATKGLPYIHTRQLDADTTAVKIQLTIETPKISIAKAGILYFRVSDVSGIDIAIGNKFVVSSKFGSYSYINIVEGKNTYFVDVPMPHGSFMFEAGLADGTAKIARNAKLNTLEHGPSSDTSFDFVSETNPISIDGVRATFPVDPEAAYQLKWAIDESSSGKSLFLFSFLDKNGEKVLPTGEFPIHPKLGPYKYVAKDDPKTVTFTVPPASLRLSVEGKHWSGDIVQLIGRPVISDAHEASISASLITDSWLTGLSETDNLMILHSTAGAISSTNKLLLRSNRIALEMSSRGWKVIYVPFGAPSDSDRVISENLIQISGTELVETVDKLVAKDLTGKRVFICSSHSDMVAVSVQNRLQDYGWKTVYEIRDDMEEFRRVGYSKWYSPALELRYATEADALIATSPRLHAKLATITGRKDIAYLPNAAPDEFIADTASMRTTSHKEQFRGTPVVGYLGHLTGSWFDWQKFIHIVKHNPRIRFEVIGHGIPDNIHLPLNVKYFGPLSHEECMPIVAKWTVGLIPFIESRLTYGVDPNKVYEYVAMGLQTVSSPMGDLENVPGVHLYRSTDEFNAALHKAISFSPNNVFFGECDSFLESSSWKFRVGQISNFVERMYK